MARAASGPRPRPRADGTGTCRALPDGPGGSRPARRLLDDPRLDVLAREPLLHLGAGERLAVPVARDLGIRVPGDEAVDVARSGRPQRRQSSAYENVHSTVTDSVAPPALVHRGDARPQATSGRSISGCAPPARSSSGRRTRCGSSCATAGFARPDARWLAAFGSGADPGPRRRGSASPRGALRSSSSSIAASYGRPGRDAEPRRNEIPRTAVVDSGPRPPLGGSHARQTTERQEREAVREAEGERDVEGARGEDRELAGRIEPRRQGVRFRHRRTTRARAGRLPEEGRGPQGRSRDRAQELACAGESGRAPRARRPCHSI